ncbi:hypothetical protein [Bradyrhizobium sp. USDA 4454]
MRIAISIGLLVLLAAVGAYAYEGLMVDAPIPAYGIALFTIGIAVLEAVCVGLMGLLFYSSSHGYDEPPHVKR